MDRRRNPYSPGAGSMPPELVGRDSLVEEFDISLTRVLNGLHSKHVLIIGLRGVGKTVLLNRATDIARDIGYEVAYLEAPEPGSFADQLSQLIHSILLSLRRGAASKAVDKALEALGLFSLGIAEGVSISLDAGARARQTANFLEGDFVSLIVAAGEAAADRKRGLLIALDEAQVLTKSELAALIAAVHRTTQMGLPVLLIGAGLPNLPKNAGEAKSYSERLFEFPALGPLEDHEAEAALKLPAEREGVRFRGDALKKMVAASSGYPYFIQEWGKHAWDIASENAITDQDVESAEVLVEASLDRNFYRVRTDRLTEKELEYLRAMAQLGEGPHRSGDIAAQLKSTSRKVAPLRDRLIKKGMIFSPSHGDTAFSVPLFDEYLRKTTEQP